MINNIARYLALSLLGIYIGLLMAWLVRRYLIWRYKRMDRESRMRATALAASIRLNPAFKEDPFLQSLAEGCDAMSKGLPTDIVLTKFPPELRQAIERNNKEGKSND